MIMLSKHINSAADLCLGTSISKPPVPFSRLPRIVPKSQDAQGYKSPALADAEHHRCGMVWKSGPKFLTAKTLRILSCQVIPEGGFGNAQISARKLGLAILQPSLIGSPQGQRLHHCCQEKRQERSSCTSKSQYSFCAKGGSATFSALRKPKEMQQCGLERDTFLTRVRFHWVSSGFEGTNTDFSFEACPGMLQQESIRNSPADQNAPWATTATSTKFNDCSSDRSGGILRQSYLQLLWIRNDLTWHELIMFLKCGNRLTLKRGCNNKSNKAKISNVDDQTGYIHLHTVGRDKGWNATRHPQHKFKVINLYGMCPYLPYNVGTKDTDIGCRSMQIPSCWPKFKASRNVKKKA